jgi:TolA-binding protein
MKNTMYCLLVVALVTTGFFSSCDSKAKKVNEAIEDVQDSKEELREAISELNEEYAPFKIEAERKIAANELRIEELRAVVNQPGEKLLDDLRRKRIEELKLKNDALKNKLSAYEKENSDWEVFKREFNHDMNGILESLKDIGKDNKN